jgi:5S rRNA maturation endonuclease (ribonuclease M5)
MEGWLDGIRAKLPGFSDDLPPRRNIFGEIISYDMGVGPDSLSPFQSRTAADTPVNREIQRLVKQHGFGMNMNAFKSIEGIELTPEQRDAYIVFITGDPHRNGTDFRKDLEKLFASDAYKAADDGQFGKQKMIHDIFRKRSARARKLMKRKNPDLRVAILEQRRLRVKAEKMKIGKAQENEQRTDNVKTLLTDLSAPVDTIT